LGREKGGFACNERRRPPEASMTDDAAIITETLERVVERVGDPTPFVFRRLFAEAPGTQDLFI